MKLRKFFMFLLVLTLTLGVCAACGDKEEPTPDGTYTVSFYDGETKVSSVEVEAGNALAESDIPAAPTGHQGEVFLGWFIGETKVEAGYKPTASVTAKANFRAASAEKYTVTVTQSNDFIVNGIKSEYSEGENVSFTISVTNTSKQLDEVTSADVTITSSNGGFSFTMPAKNVTVTVTLKAADPQGGEGPNEPEEEVDERIQLFMKGDLYLHHSRTIYATLSGGLSGDLEWSSDDINVVSIGSSEKAVLQGDMPEALLHANATGTATIRCALKNNIKIFNEYEITVRDASTGTSMPEDLYQQLTGSIKLTSTEQFLDFAAANFDKDDTGTASKTNDIITIFEEITDESAGNDLVDINMTDAFQIEVKDRATQEVSFAYKYVTNGRQVCTEERNINNEVFKKQVQKTDTDGDSDTVEWAGSTYTNIFGSRPSYTNRDLWKSFDGGHTYYFVGSDSYPTYICAFLYQANISPDDIYFEVEDGEIVKLTVVIDPANYQNSKKFGRKIETTFSEIGTAKIDHVKTFDHETYHDSLKNAIDKMAALKTYKATLTYDGKKYEFTYLPDTIDVVVRNAASNAIEEHYGAHKYGEGEGDGKTYYKYTYNDDTKELIKTEEFSSPWEGVGTGEEPNAKNIVRYPTFAFAAEIFGQGTKENTFVSRIGNGQFVRCTCYLPMFTDYEDFSTDGTIEINAEGYVVEVSTIVDGLLDTKNSLTIVYSDFTTATLDIQFEEVITPTNPTWEEGDAKFYGILKADAGWQDVIELLPFVPCTPGYDSGMGIMDNASTSQGVKDAVTYIRTNTFTNQDQCNEFVTEYEEALIAAGWVKGEKRETNEYLTGESAPVIYEKDGYMVSVAPGLNYAGKANVRWARITLYTSLAST